MKINKKSNQALEDFLIRSNTGHITKTNGGISCELFAHLDDKKRAIAFIKSQGLDPFKRGTKEPEAIEAALATASWETIKEIDPATSGTRTMWD